MSDEEESSKDSAAPSWPEHKMGTWPDWVKELIVGMWTAGTQPKNIAQKVNELGVLSNKVNGHGVSQFLTNYKKSNPEILDKRKESKEELLQVAKELGPQIRQNIVGRMREATLKVIDEVQDGQPDVIRDIMEQLKYAEKPQTLRELSTSLNIQMNILERLSGISAARDLAIYEEKKRIDEKYRPNQEGDDAKKAGSSVVEVDGWDGP